MKYMIILDLYQSQKIDISDSQVSKLKFIKKEFKYKFSKYNIYNISKENIYIDIIFTFLFFYSLDYNFIEKAFAKLKT